MKVLVLLVVLCLVAGGQVAGAEAQSVCHDNESCVGLSDCPDLNSVAKRIRATKVKSKRLQLLEMIKDKLCGNLEQDLKVCCRLSDGRGLRLRPLTFHSLEGEVEVLDGKHLRIHNFVHDGTGPDAFFIVGINPEHRRPNAQDAIPVPFPSIENNKEELQFTSHLIPIVNKEFRGETITLTMPGTITTDQLQWLSLFCRDFDTDFGHVVF